MTTYAFRNGILACDSAISSCDVIHGTTVKTAKMGPILSAASGNARLCRRFMDWFRSGMKDECPPMAECFGEETYRAYAHIFTQTDMVVRFEPGGSHTFRASYVADGSGMHLAMGALAAGASALEAVEAAVKHDIYSRGPVIPLYAVDLRSQ